MLSLTIAGGIFLLDYKIKEHIDSTRLQGSKEEVLGGRLLLRNCHNKDKILGKVKIGRADFVPPLRQEAIQHGIVPHRHL